VEVKVLGAGCARCKTLFEDAKKAMELAGLGAAVEYVSDITVIMNYDVLMTPALVINGEVKAAGRVPSITEMVTWFTNAAVAEG
jgi:small redox-active disulfide protein 2